jgi:hypothetical protein
MADYGNKPNPFIYANAINTGKDIITDADDPLAAEEAYQPHMINKAMSTSIDAVLHANEMNMRGGLDKALQYQYFLNSLAPRRRGAKWYKPDQSEDVALIQSLYPVNAQRAAVMLSLLSEEQKQHLKTITTKGVTNYDGKNTRHRS